MKSDELKLVCEICGVGVEGPPRRKHPLRATKDHVCDECGKKVIEGERVYVVPWSYFRPALNLPNADLARSFVALSRHVVRDPYKDRDDAEEDPRVARAAEIVAELIRRRNAGRARFDTPENLLARAVLRSVGAQVGGDDAEIEEALRDLERTILTEE